MDYKNYLKKAKNFINRLSKKPKIGGLVIRDSMLQFVLIDDKKVNLESLKLPPGVILNGILKDKEGFKKIILKFYDDLILKFFKNKKNYRIKIIVNLPSELVFVKSFDVPKVGENLINQSAYLNLQMVSPIKAEEGYFSWQKISEEEDKINFLGATIFKEIINDYKFILEEAGFYPIVFEFNSLALARLIKEILAVEGKSILVVYISFEGIDLFFLKNGSIYFSHFRSWDFLENRQITREKFEEVLKEEVNLVLNFALNQFYEEIKQVLLIAPNLEDLSVGLLSKNYPNLKIYPLKSLNINNIPITAFWFSGLGSALRGLKERHLDNEITLSSLTSIEEYYREQILDFAIFWRNILIGVLGLFLLIYIGLNIFLVNYLNDLNDQVSRIDIQPLTKELENYKKVEEKFNNLVDLAALVLNTQPKIKIYLTLEKLNNLLVENNVRFKGGIINLNERKMELNLLVKETADVFKFKNILNNEEYLKNNDLPLSEIKNVEGEGVNFKLFIRLD